MDAVLSLNAFHSFTVGVIVFLLGWRINNAVSLFQEYTIPEPVTGGLLIAMLLAFAHAVFGFNIEFDMGARDELMLYFFTAIGLNASFKKLLSGGLSLAVLLAATIVFLIAQDLIGTSLASLIGLEPTVGLLAGSISLVGGHGTAIAWAPVIASQHNVPNALEIGTACATFGLVLASLMGGPIAQYFIRTKNLTPPPNPQLDIGTMRSESIKSSFDSVTVLRTLLALHIAIFLGLLLQESLDEFGIMLPSFVPCLVMGIILTNIVPLIFPKYPWPAESRPLALIAEVALGVFLAMSLMSLDLLNLASLAGPLAILLGAQFIFSVAFTSLIIFKIMGKDYESAVICAGFGGIAMGSTPTAIANMTAVSERYGAAPKAFIIVPLVCSFFIDIMNAMIISFFLS